MFRDPLHVGFAKFTFPSVLKSCAQQSVVEEGEQTLGLYPHESTMVSIVTTVSHIGLPGFGRRVHGYLMDHEFSLEGVLGAALIDMHSKCGSILSSSCIFFERISDEDVGHWTRMVVGFAIQGHAEASLQLFSLTKASSVKPNHVTSIGVLIACNRGLVD